MEDLFLSPLRTQLQLHFHRSLCNTLTLNVIMTSCRAETETVSRMQNWTIRPLLQPSVSGVAVSLLVSVFTVDILSTYATDSWFRVLIKFPNLWFLLFDCYVYRQNVTCLIHFTRYGHYAGEVEDIMTARLAIVS